MALNPTSTAASIVSRIQTLIDNATTEGVFDPDALTRDDIWEEVVTQIFNDVKADIAISMEIPIGAVITSVTGGSFSPAVGVANASAIAIVQVDVE